MYLHCLWEIDEQNVTLPFCKRVSFVIGSLRSKPLSNQVSNYHLCPSFGRWLSLKYMKFLYLYVYMRSFANLYLLRTVPSVRRVVRNIRKKE